MAATSPRAGRRGGGRRPRRQLAAINVTPFVDVMLVLLIVFMVTAPLLTAGVQVDLPESAAPGLPGQDEPLAVTVTRDGEIFLEDTAVALDALVPRLLAITQENRDARLFVRGDRALTYGRIMAVLGTLNRAGFTRVALVSEPATSGG